MGQLAARIDAEARQTGAVIPFADLQIGVTAVHCSSLELCHRHTERPPFRDDSESGGETVLKDEQYYITA
jgi:predicted nucleic acid-binding protein